MFILFISFLNLKSLETSLEPLNYIQVVIFIVFVGKLFCIEALKEAETKTFSFDESG